MSEDGLYQSHVHGYLRRVSERIAYFRFAQYSDLSLSATASVVQFVRQFIKIKVFFNSIKLNGIIIGRVPLVMRSLGRKGGCVSTDEPIIIRYRNRK